jgi:hypothetical protein
MVSKVTACEGRGVFHYFAQGSSLAPVVEGRRLRKGLCQE